MQWISVKDRLPKTGEAAIVWVKTDHGGGSGMAIRKENKWEADTDFVSGYEYEPEVWYDKYPSTYDGIITHWMPLPDPPDLLKE